MSGIFSSKPGLDPREGTPERSNEPAKEKTVGTEDAKEELSAEVKKVADGLLDTITSRAKVFLDDNADAQKFVQERTVRMAKLLIEYKLETDEAKREQKKARMALVQSTIETELASVALTGHAETKALFKEIVNTAFAAAIKIIPALI